MSDIISFDFESAPLRIIPKDDGSWFVLADVCHVLEHTNAAVASRRLDDDEKGVTNVYTPGGQQAVAIINESGLYSLVLTSRKAAVKKFKRWVTGEVLPAIRKTGGYLAAGAHETVEELTARATAVLKDTVARQRVKLDEISSELDWAQRQLHIAQPKLKMVERLYERRGLIELMVGAKTLQQKPYKFMARLRETGYLHYFKHGSTRINIPYQQFIDRGFFVVKWSFNKGRPWPRTYFTHAGLLYFANKLNKSQAAE